MVFSPEQKENLRSDVRVVVYRGHQESVSVTHSSPLNVHLPLSESHVERYMLSLGRESSSPLVFVYGLVSY